MFYTDPFAEADEDTGETKQSQNYIHIRIQRMSSLPSSLFTGFSIFFYVFESPYLSSEFVTDITALQSAMVEKP